MEGEAASNGVVEEPSHSPNMNGASTSVREKADYQSLELTDKGIIHSEHGGKRTDLSVQIPPRHADSSGSRGGKGSSRGSSSARGILRGPSFKNQVPILDERSSLLDSDLAARAGPTVVAEKASLATSIASLTWKRCVSLPIRQESILSPSTSIPARDKACNEQHPSKKQAIPANVQRSLSMPLRNVVILRSRSSPTSKVLGQTDTSEDLTSPAHLGDGDEEIPEEDAVCRVCLDDLSEGGSSLQLECRCKGALRLIHEECAMKWFGIKGNRMCDVCGAEILNLPVTLIRMPSSSRADGRQQHHVRRRPNSAVTRAWQDVMVLMLISTMCYFFFIEQLLIQIRAIYAILFSSFAGLGAALAINALFLLVLAKRAQLIRTQRMDSSSV